MESNDNEMNDNDNDNDNIPISLNHNNGDMLLGDIGSKFPYKTSSFDGVISVSCIQWLFYPMNKDQDAYKRIKCFMLNL